MYRGLMYFAVGLSFGLAMGYNKGLGDGYQAYLDQYVKLPPPLHSLPPVRDTYPELDNTKVKPQN